jgi:hypothetical protein
VEVSGFHVVDGWPVIDTRGSAGLPVWPGFAV